MKEAARSGVVFVAIVLAGCRLAAGAGCLAPQGGPESRSASRPAGAIGLGPGSRPAAGAKDPQPATRIARRNVLAGSIQATEKAVFAGLDWLQRHQSPDGSWD